MEEAKDNSVELWTKVDISPHRNLLRNAYHRFFSFFDEESFNLTLDGYLDYYKFSKEPAKNTIKRTYDRYLRLVWNRNSECDLKLKINLPVYKISYTTFSKEGSQKYGRDLEEYINFEQAFNLYNEMYKDLNEVIKKTLGTDEELMKDRYTRRDIIELKFGQFINKVYYFYFNSKKKFTEKNKSEFIEFYRAEMEFQDYNKETKSSNINSRI